MTTYNHTPITPNTPANSADANPPLASLDAAIGSRTTLGPPTKTSLVGAINDIWNEIITARGSYPSLSAWVAAAVSAVQPTFDGLMAKITAVETEVKDARLSSGSLTQRLYLMVVSINANTTAIAAIQRWGGLPDPNNPYGTQGWSINAPGGGPYTRGSIMWNTQPSITRNITHWRCIADGTPGLWRAFGTGRGLSSERPVLVPNDTGYTYWDTDLGKLIHWNGASWDA